MEDFKEALFSCEKTPGLFCFLLTFACLGGPCCVQGKLNSEFSKKHFIFHCMLPCLCLCIGATYNRSLMRSQLGLNPNWVPDLLSHLFCGPCAVNQEFLEFHSRSVHGNLNLLALKRDRPGKFSFTPAAPVDPTVN